MPTPVPSVLLADREFQNDGNGQAVWGVLVNPNRPIYYLSDGALDISGARRECRAWGGDLTNVESKVIDSFIISAVVHKEPTLQWWWIGYRYFPATGYQWTNGAKDTYNNLAAGNGGFCTVAGMKIWEKSLCGPTIKHYYICKKKL